MKTLSKTAEPKASTVSASKVEAPVKATEEKVNAKQETEKKETEEAKETVEINEKAKVRAAKKPAAKKSAAKRTVAKAAAAKKPAAKRGSRKSAAPVVNEEVYLQFWGKEVATKEVVERIKKVWAEEMGKAPEALLDLKVYIKPEENVAHYVLNGDVTGFIGL